MVRTKLKIKWHLYWATYHMLYMEELVKQNKFNDAYIHSIKWCEHVFAYANLGGDMMKLPIELLEVNNS